MTVWLSSERLPKRLREKLMQLVIVRRIEREKMDQKKEDARPTRAQEFFLGMLDQRREHQEQKQNVRRPNHVSVRLSDREQESYQRVAGMKGWSVSELLRRAADEMVKEADERGE